VCSTARALASASAASCGRVVVAVARVWAMDRIVLCQPAVNESSSLVSGPLSWRRRSWRAGGVAARAAAVLASTSWVPHIQAQNTWTAGRGRLERSTGPDVRSPAPVLVACPARTWSPRPATAPGRPGGARRSPDRSQRGTARPGGHHHRLDLRERRLPVAFPRLCARAPERRPVRRGIGHVHQHPVDPAHRHPRQAHRRRRIIVDEQPGHLPEQLFQRSRPGLVPPAADHLGGRHVPARAQGTSAGWPASWRAASAYPAHGIRAIATVSRMTSGSDISRCRCGAGTHPPATAAAAIASITPSPIWCSSSPSRTKSGSHPPAAPSRPGAPPPARSPPDGRTSPAHPLTRQLPPAERQPPHPAVNLQVTSAEHHDRNQRRRTDLPS
jgi:hypothetical protein